jgi:(p)ppGpp synthase/HD superfamily hydrolase
MKIESTIVAKALCFATEAHKGQVRKYSGEPYINHPINVATIVSSVTDNQNMIAAALLHDVVEDTDVTQEDIGREFNFMINSWVESLTDVSKPEDGNRVTRKNIDLQHTKLGLPPAKTIKLADLIDNYCDIYKHDKGFAKVYMAEKKKLLEVLKQGNKTLYNRALDIVENYYNYKKK